MKPIPGLYETNPGKTAPSFKQNNQICKLTNLGQTQHCQVLAFFQIQSVTKTKDVFKLSFL